MLADLYLPEIAYNQCFHIGMFHVWIGTAVSHPGIAFFCTASMKHSAYELVSAHNRIPFRISSVISVDITVSLPETSLRMARMGRPTLEAASAEHQPLRPAPPARLPPGFPAECERSPVWAIRSKCNRHAHSITLTAAHLPWALKYDFLLHDGTSFISPPSQEGGGKTVGGLCVGNGILDRRRFIVYLPAGIFGFTWLQATWAVGVGYGSFGADTKSY